MVDEEASEQLPLLLSPRLLVTWYEAAKSAWGKPDGKLDIAIMFFGWRVPVEVVHHAAEVSVLEVLVRGEEMGYAAVASTACDIIARVNL